MGVNRYEDLEIWQIARGLVREVYTVSGGGRFNRDFETQSVLYVALDLGYITQQEFDKMYETCRKLYAMIGALRRHLAYRSAA